MSSRLPKLITDNTSLPIISAPMFLVSGPDLVLACCKNGVIGSFPAPNARTIETLDNWMNKLTTELKIFKENNPNEKVGPWAANIIAHRTYDRLKEELDLIKKYQPPIVITALGSPAQVIETVHSYGGLVFADVNSIEYAKKAANTGVDGLVLISAGAGGHTGTITGFAFVDAVREFWDGIIVLAGGVSTGKSILAAQSLGADLVYMGTSFIAAEESMADPQYKDMLIESTYDDLICTDSFTGVHANMLRQSIEKAGHDISELKSRKNKIDFGNTQDTSSKPWKNIWSAGHGVNTIKKVQTASEIISNLEEEYKAAYSTMVHSNEWMKTEIKS